jgi:hypothetical protein
MRQFEELVESSKVLVLHDWELYRAEKAKFLHKHQGRDREPG